MRLVGGILESKATEPAGPTLVLSHSASENGTCTMPPLPNPVSPAPVVLDFVQGGPLRGASAVYHKDQSCTAAAPDDGVWLAAPLAGRGSDPMQAETFTGGDGMCVLTSMRNCVRLALRRQRSAAPRRADCYVQGAAAVGDDRFG